MDQINILNQSSAILLTLIISIIFVIVGLVYSKKYQGLNNYLVASRSVGTFSLTTSLVASALGEHGFYSVPHQQQPGEE